jgi:hypothetical protein
MNVQRICTVFIYQRKFKNLEGSICEHFWRVCFPLKNCSRNSECVNETYCKFHISLNQELSTTFNSEDRLRNIYILSMEQQTVLIGPRHTHCRGFTITLRHVTLIRTPLDEVISLTHSQDSHPCPRQDSNSQSQRVSGRRPTTQTALPLGPAVWKI